MRTEVRALSVALLLSALIAPGPAHAWPWTTDRCFAYWLRKFSLPSPVPATAVPASPSTFRNPRTRIRSTFRGEGINYLPAQQALRTVRGIDTWLGRVLDAPRSLQLAIGEWGGSASQDFEYWNISLRPSLLHPVVIAHEYGHAYFIENLRHHSSEWAAYIAYHQTYAEFRERHIAPLERAHRALQLEFLNLRRQRRTTPEQQAARRALLSTQLKARLDEMGELIDAFHAHMPEVRRPANWGQEDPYNELFADLVAVIHLNDPKALVPILEQAPNGRDFTREIPLKGWNDKDPHHLLDPVRSFLWKNYFSKTPGLAERARLLELVHSACAAEFLAWAQLPAPRPSIEVQNRRLIDRLKRELPVLR